MILYAICSLYFSLILTYFRICCTKVFFYFLFLV